MNGRILWTTIPEAFEDPALCAVAGLKPVRRPDLFVTAASEHNGRAYLELHPWMKALACYNFGEGTRRVPAEAFQQPGEGPWRVWPEFPHSFCDDVEGGVKGIDPRVRMENTIHVACELGAHLRETKGPRCRVWDLGGAYSGVLAIGLAKALGRVVVVSHEKPDRLAIAMMDAHRVTMIPVVDRIAMRKAREFLAEY